MLVVGKKPARLYVRIGLLIFFVYIFFSGLSDVQSTGEVLGMLIGYLIIILLVVFFTEPKKDQK